MSGLPFQPPFTLRYNVRFMPGGGGGIQSKFCNTRMASQNVSLDRILVVQKEILLSRILSLSV